MEFWEKLLAGLAISLGLLLGAFILSEKHTTGYYLGSVNESNKGYCVSADITWMADPVVYCSDDISKTLEVYSRLK